jgi:hypothetical protein
MTGHVLHNKDYTITMGAQWERGRIRMMVDEGGE